MITLPASTTEDVFTNAGYIFTDFWPLILLAVGLPLGFYLVKKLIGLLPKR
jgi:hypothetical protein